MARIALGLEYFGGAFCGWQTQPSGCAVQDALECALSEIAGEAVATICAGRTDAGVHAVGQVVHFDASAHRPESAWVRGVNALLPPQIAVLWARTVADDFHARYGARERRYRYVLLNQRPRPGLNHRRVGWIHAPLELLPMREAARLLIGRHDFSAFRSAQCQAKSPVRELRAVEILSDGDYLVFDLAADGFLQHMVRNLVGSLVYVGKGKYPACWIAEVLASCDRARGAPTLDPAGLYLTHVVYDAHWGLPQAKQSAGTGLQCLI